MCKHCFIHQTTPEQSSHPIYQKSWFQIAFHTFFAFRKHWKKTTAHKINLNPTKYTIHFILLVKSMQLNSTFVFCIRYLIYCGYQTVRISLGSTMGESEVSIMYPRSLSHIYIYICTHIYIYIYICLLIWTYTRILAWYYTHTWHCIHMYVVISYCRCLHLGPIDGCWDDQRHSPSEPLSPSSSRVAAG